MSWNSWWKHKIKSQTLTTFTLEYKGRQIDQPNHFWEREREKWVWSLAVLMFSLVLFGLLGIGLFSFFVPKKVLKGQVTVRNFLKNKKLSRLEIGNKADLKRRRPPSFWFRSRESLKTHPKKKKKTTTNVVDY